MSVKYSLNRAVSCAGYQRRNRTRQPTDADLQTNRVSVVCTTVVVISRFSEIGYKPSPCRSNLTLGVLSHQSRRHPPNTLIGALPVAPLMNSPHFFPSLLMSVIFPGRLREIWAKKKTKNGEPSRLLNLGRTFLGGCKLYTGIGLQNVFPISPLSGPILCLVISFVP